MKKRLLSTLLALCLCVGLGVGLSAPSVAAEPTYTKIPKITIDVPETDGLQITFTNVASLYYDSGIERYAARTETSGFVNIYIRTIAFFSYDDSTISFNRQVELCSASNPDDPSQSRTIKANEVVQISELDYEYILPLLTEPNATLYDPASPATALTGDFDEYNLWFKREQELASFMSDSTIAEHLLPLLQLDTATPAPTEKPSSWAQTDVDEAIADGFVPQSLRGAYTQTMTRAEFCALAVTFYETATRSKIEGREKFTDTTDINVEKAAALGIVNGVGDGKFDPDGALTREQAATMLARLAIAGYSPLPPKVVTFADKGSISSWAIDAVGKMQSSGIMGGVGDNNFAPRQPYTREQSIVTILRLYKFVTATPKASNYTLSASLTKGMTDAELQEAFEMAYIIAAQFSRQSRQEQLEGIYEYLRMFTELMMSYTDTDKHYNDVYGFFVLNAASCAGATRAVGLCLTILGIPYEHVNENQWTHQWCRVEVVGAYWICDAYGMYVGPEPGVREHPWL